MNLNIICHFCFESFEVQIESNNELTSEIWDCEICCNPNLIKYKIKDDIYNILEEKRDPALELIANSIIHDEDFIFKDENYLN